MCFLLSFFSLYNHLVNRTCYYIHLSLVKLPVCKSARNSSITDSQLFAINYKIISGITLRLFGTLSESIQHTIITRAQRAHTSLNTYFHSELTIIQSRRIQSSFIICLLFLFPSPGQLRNILDPNQAPQTIGFRTFMFFHGL